MMQRLQDMFDQLRGMFPDKEALKKKLAALEKNVSIDRVVESMFIARYHASCMTILMFSLCLNFCIGQEPL